MQIRLLWAAAALVASRVFAANIQTEDLFFFSTHKNPTQVVSDSKNAFVLTESGVLVYDYRRQAWTDNLAPGGSVQTIRYSSRRSRLYLTAQGRVLEYNDAFRRFTDASQEDFNEAGDAGEIPSLDGLTMDGDFLSLGGAIRDKYMRRAVVNQARLFEYDNLWILTQGLGPFFGSYRRKRANSLWFGLDDPAATVIYPEGNNIWFGSCATGGAVVKAGKDLNGWRVFPSGLEFGFSNGCVHDVTSWKNFIWLATESGVVRHDPRTGRFQAYSHMQGGTDLRVYCLRAHQGRLYAGSEEGVSMLAEPRGEFQSLPLPGSVRIPVHGLESGDGSLWAATQYGLYLHDGEAWKTLRDVSGRDVPESYGTFVPSALYHDSTLYWISGDRVMFKSRGGAAKVLLTRDRASRLRWEGGMLYIAFYSGVTAYNTVSGLWTDFRLEDGIRGTAVLGFNVFDGKLWVGTDAGVTRIVLKPYLP